MNTLNQMTIDDSFGKYWLFHVRKATALLFTADPKEQALLDICRREVQAGNQVWVYCQMTGKRDIQPRLKQILAEAGFRVAIMRSRSVKTRDRLDWIEKEGKKNDIVISHPQLVQTGLDFFGKKPGSHNFNAIAFYETGYNPFTMQQAARRAWRIGQSKDCRVYYLHYRDTMQQRAMALAANFQRIRNSYIDD